MREWSLHPPYRALSYDVIDGPFRWKWQAETWANTHQAHEAQRARVEGDVMGQVDVMEAPHDPLV